MSGDDDARDREALRSALPRPPADAADTLLAALHRSRLAATMFGETEAVTVDRYIVRRELGRGGMGVVFVAEDPLLAVPVALKLLQRGPPRPGDSAAESLLQREAQALARVRGDHVVRVYSAGFFMGQPWIAMQLVDGPHLGEWLRARSELGRPDWREVLARYVEAGRGLQAIHAAGLVHRDFKPQNAVVDADGCVKVLDFGLAAAVSERAAADEPRLGTQRYAAPEQFLGRDLDPRSDQFSFCVALYEALCGTPPFGDAVSTGERLAADPATRTPRPTRELPGWLIAALLRGLAAAPADRHANMAALLHELTRDRRRGLRVAALVGAGFLAGASVFLLAGRVGHDPRCDAIVDDDWPTQRARLALPDSERTRLDRAVDDHRQRWQTSRAALCATPPADADTLTLRHACLTHVHATLVAVLARSVIQPARLGDALSRLPAPEHCLELAASPARASEPPRGLVAQVEAELAEADAAHLYGDHAQALVRIDRADQLAASSEDPRLLARVAFARGLTARDAGDRRTAAAALSRALNLVRSIDAAFAVEILHERVRLDLLTYQTARDGQRDLEDADLTLAGLGGDVPGDRLAMLRAEHHDMRGLLRSEALDHHAAIGEHDLAIAAWKQMPPRPDVQRRLYESLRARARARVELPDLPAAIADQREALQLAVDLHGPTHPALVDLDLDLARSHASHGALPEARAAAQRARESLDGRDGSGTARSRCQLAALERDVGDPRRAELEARKAVDLATTDPDLDPRERSDCEYLLAMLAVQNHSPEADVLLQRAIDGLQGAPGPQAACDRAYLQAIRGLYAVRRGDPDRADELVRAAPQAGCPTQSMVPWVRAGVARARADPAAAEQLLQAAIDHPGEHQALQRLELAELLHAQRPGDPRIRGLAAAAEPELRRQGYADEAAAATRLLAP